MHTATHTTDRRQEPRRLVPRRPVSAHVNNPATILGFRLHLRSKNPAKFQVGDMITFEKASGRNWPLLILDIRGNDVDVICYNGNPHLVRIKVTTLDALRIVKIEKFNTEAVDMYRALVGLDIDHEAAA